MKKNVFENVNELEHTNQTLVSIENVFKFIMVCAAAGIVVGAGAYEVAADGVSIIGQWYYN